MMRMTFFWGTDLGEFFFPGLEVNTATALAIASAITALFAILYEGIKVSPLKFYFSNLKIYSNFYSFSYDAGIFSKRSSEIGS